MMNKKQMFRHAEPDSASYNRSLPLRSTAARRLAQDAPLEHLVCFQPSLPKFGMTGILILFLSLFISCTTEVTLTLKQDDSLDIQFEGGAGKAFAKMINSAAGAGGSENDELFIDSDSVSFELAKAGFSNVKVNQKKGGQISISMSDKKQSSYLFTSKIVKAEKGRLTSAITRKSLEDFYDSSDEQTRMILDLFLAPVFNNEEMSESEYIEMLGAFYGQSAAKEVEQSYVVIKLISKDGSKENLRYPLTQLMCGLF